MTAGGKVLFRYIATPPLRPLLESLLIRVNSSSWTSPSVMSAESHVSVMASICGFSSRTNCFSSGILLKRLRQFVEWHLSTVPEVISEGLEVGRVGGRVKASSSRFPSAIAGFPCSSGPADGLKMREREKGQGYRQWGQDCLRA